MDSKKQLQCFAATVAGRYSAYAVMQFLITETSLHDRCTQIAYYAPGARNIRRLIFGLGTFPHKVCGNAIFGAVTTVGVGGVYCIHADAGDLHSGQRLLIFNALAQARSFVESLEGMVLDERDSVNLNVVDLGAELDPFVLFATHYGAEIRSVDADDTVLHFLFIEEVGLLLMYQTDCRDTFVLLSCENNQRGILTVQPVPLSDDFAQQIEQPPLHPACG